MRGSRPSPVLAPARLSRKKLFRKLRWCEERQKFRRKLRGVTRKFVEVRSAMPLIVHRALHTPSTTYIYIHKHTASRNRHSAHGECERESEISEIPQTRYWNIMIYLNSENGGGSRQGDFHEKLLRNFCEICGVLLRKLERKVVLTCNKSLAGANMHTHAAGSESGSSHALGSS